MEFGQKTYGSPAMESAGSAPGAAPAGGLDMGSDSSKVKMGISAASSPSSASERPWP